MESDLKSEEIASILNEVKQRVRARHPSGSVALNSVSGPLALALPDLLPIVHARDAAQGKMAAIGSVNPRQGGVVNAVVQKVKRIISRGLNWFVRDQVTFNREVVSCVETILDALNENNRALSLIASQLDEARAISDLRAHWQTWRVEWEQNLRQNEINHLRAVADMQNSFHHRVTLMDAAYRESVRAQHAAYVAAIWQELEKGTRQFEALIHSELRVLRQKMPATTPASLLPPLSVAEPAFDYQRFADRFRGSEDYVRRNHRVYLPHFAGHHSLVDIGCGRGEMLELMREQGLSARGIDLSATDVAYCRSKGLDAVQADLFTYLNTLPDRSEDIIFSSQVVEHIDTARLPEMIRLCAAKLRRGGILALETPNPECLAIFATHFYLDPTHVRPVPRSLLVFYMEEAGLGSIKIERLSPAVESFPEIAELPPAFAARFFGGLDYAIFGIKL